LPKEEIHTPEVRTIEEVCAFLDVRPENVIKTLVFSADDVPVAVLVRGDEEVNEIKVKNYLGCDVLEMAMDDMIQETAGSPRGFVGPIGIKCRVLADYSLMNLTNMVVGANKEDYHLKNVNFERDFKATAFADLRAVRETDPCPRCAGAINFARGIEVGHVFKLGTKYSKAMKAIYLDKNGKEQYMVMGCYGIGVGRTVAACIEQYHDDNGIIWPPAIAPYQVIITPVNMNDPELAATAENLYADLLSAGVEAILDDRDERAGVKFKDADLIGIPLRVTIGPKNLAAGNLEIKVRRTGEVRLLSVGEAKNYIMSAILQE
jgi:prolyl-tRNA synthetase